MPLDAFNAAAISLVAAGSRLEKSTSNWPFLAPSAMPAAPNTTSRTTAVSARQSMTTSACAHSSAGVETCRAPASTSGKHLSGLRFHTVNAKPAAINRWHIGKPIRPIPANPREGKVATGGSSI
ncbi:hypothetical protein UB23_20110 [Pseudomonas sp. ES3-33]|nr:hypothetical protein UB23_20110 [Pseudomonas sp. ES3-33]